jgi:hypothetical protein
MEGIPDEGKPARFRHVRERDRRRDGDVSEGT